MDLMSCLQVATTLTMPPPLEASTVRSAISCCILAILFCMTPAWRTRSFMLRMLSSLKGSVGRGFP